MAKLPPSTFMLLGGIVSAVAIGTGVLTYHRATDENGRYVCENRVQNTYLALSAMILFLVGCSILLMPWADARQLTLPKVIGLAILGIVSFLVAYLVNPMNKALKFSALLVHLLVDAYLYAILNNYTASSILVWCLCIVALIFFVLTWFAYRFEHLLLAQHHRILNYAILTVIVAYLLASFFKPGLVYYIAIPLFILVVASVAYKAKALKEKPCSAEKPPDHVRDGLSILVDLRVLFDLLRGFLRGRRRR